MAQSWRDVFADKIVRPHEAIKKIRPGSRIFIGSECGTPRMLVQALIEHADALADIEVVHLNRFIEAPYAEPKYASVFRANAFVIGSGIREAINKVQADYTPVCLSEVSNLFRDRSMSIDAALITVTPPDEYGYCSLGVSVDVTKAAAESAKMLIVQVNEYMPRTLGDTFIHVDQIHHLIEGDEPLLEWKSGQEQDKINSQVAAHVVRLVSDGATLQVGVGPILDALLSALTDKNDLGVHTEIISNEMMRLARAGVITGKHKTIHPRKIVGNTVVGGRRLFDFVNRNPQIEMHPSDYVCNPLTIGGHDNMVSINLAPAVDLTGQVCNACAGSPFQSGIDEQNGFLRGAALSKGGKPIIVLPSTVSTSSGIRSRILADLQEGAGVIGTRADTHYVVTEYGVAYLHGKSIRERAMSLIGIAHPDFRAELLHAAKHRRMVYANQIMPPRAKPYPAEYESNVQLKDGSEVFIRPIRPDDEPMMKEMFYSFSEQTVYLRYHSVLKSMPHNKLQIFCNVDYDTEMALIGMTGSPGDLEVVGVGRYMTDAAKENAEMAFVVRDDWQGKGLGTLLFTKLVEIAKTNNIHKLSADVLVANSGMLKIFHRSGLVIKTTSDGGVVHVSMSPGARESISAV